MAPSRRAGHLRRLRHRAVSGVGAEDGAGRLSRALVPLLLFARGLGHDADPVPRGAGARRTVVCDAHGAGAAARAVHLHDDDFVYARGQRGRGPGTPRGGAAERRAGAARGLGRRGRVGEARPRAVADGAAEPRQRHRADGPAAAHAVVAHARDHLGGGGPPGAPQRAGVHVGQLVHRDGVAAAPAVAHAV
ncbi:hypothetical protein PWT90_11160 [Aphanocladium album]|nr:hypothetical protein PWT90_11160 [Aphanocladium album]